MAHLHPVNENEKICMVQGSDNVLNDTNSDNNSFEISCNWFVTDNRKELKNVVSVSSNTDASARMSLEDIVDETRCIEIKPESSPSEACNIEMKIKNGRKIKRIDVVSEASVLEIFRENGEYAFTVFAELIDEFEDSTVHHANINFNLPTSEVTIKFTRIKNNRFSMFLYGIKLIYDELQYSSNLSYRLELNSIIDILANSLKERDSTKYEEKNDSTNDQHHTDDNISNSRAPRSISSAYNNFKTELIKNKESKNVDEQNVRAKYLHDNCDLNIISFIDVKLKEMEKRILDRICLMEANTQKKFNEIQNLLELCDHAKNVE